MAVQYADGYHEIFADSDSEGEDFHGFHLGPDLSESESEVDDDESGKDDDRDEEQVQGRNFVEEDPFANDFMKMLG